MTSVKDVFNQQLEEEKQAQVESFSPRTVRDFIRICLPYIRKEVKKKTSWDIIAKAIKAVAEESYDVKIRIAPSTAKRAYYALTSKKKGKQSKSRSRSTSTTSQQSKPSAEAAAQVPSTTSTPEPAPRPEPVARSPAAAEPKSEAAKPTAVDKSPAADQQVTSTQDLHPNRFRDRFKKAKKRNPKTTTGYENCKSL